MNEPYAQQYGIAPAGPAAPVYATVEDLITANLDDGAEDLQLPSGLVVRVRGLSRYELMNNGKGTEDPRVIEVRNAVSCVVSPKLSIELAEQWQRRSLAGGDFKVLSEKIRDLSGLRREDAKSDVAADGAGGA